MNNLSWRVVICALCIAASFPTSAAARDESQRKNVLELASRVANWQLAHMGATSGVTRFAEETANSRSWQQGAFWVGMTHLADATRDRRFSDAILAMGKANQWKPGP